jgi:7,8-dihydropterin-6-yl-methyl-4-(beta-D-ribofuranosyl)aminobenzene 5'-phosphate synthase
MKIISLVENTTNNKTLKSKHGLSCYIETIKHKVLFDLGPNDAFIHNARKLGIDLAQIDTVVISHGHFDHGGGLAGFLDINKKAKIYLHKLAFEPYYIKVLFLKKYIGLDRKLAGSERFIMTDEHIRIDDELFIFSDVDGQFESNSTILLKKTTDGYIRDDFAHEQNLIVTTEDKTILFSGCSHRGIANIMQTAHNHFLAIQAAFGGFHMCNPITNVAEPKEVVQSLAKELSVWETKFYTGHCTGSKAFDCMRKIMGNNKVQHFSTGTVIEL